MTGRDRPEGQESVTTSKSHSTQTHLLEPEGSESELQCEASSNRKPWIALKNLQL